MKRIKQAVYSKLSDRIFMFWVLFGSFMAILLTLIFFLIFSSSADDVAGKVVETGVSSDAATSEDQSSAERERTTLYLPLEYFDSDAMGASFGGSVYFKDGYRSEPRPIEDPQPVEVDWDLGIPPVKPDSEIISEDSMFFEHFTEQIERHGDWARRFLPEYTVEYFDEFDVTGDGVPETIIGVCSLGGNGCPHDVLVITESLEVMATFGGRSLISPVENGQGFVREWERTHRDPEGRILTRYIYRNGTFYPLYEQQIKYYEVVDTKLDF